MKAIHSSFSLSSPFLKLILLQVSLELSKLECIYNDFNPVIYQSLYSLTCINFIHSGISVFTISYVPICFLIIPWCVSKTVICSPVWMNYSRDLDDSVPTVSDWDEWSFIVIHFVDMMGEHIVTLHSKPLEATLAKGRNDD